MLDHIVGLISPNYRFKSAVSGRFVTKAYAMLHPMTTYRMRIDREER